MISLQEGDENLKQLLSDKNYEKIFKLVQNEKMIGIGAITGEEDNQIMIFIKKELRGNGYGKILFSEMKKIMKSLGYTKINLKIEKYNIQMLKIITSNGGVHISTNRDVLEYTVPNIEQ